MRNRTKILAILLSVSTVFLTGCNDADIAKLNQMAVQAEAIAESAGAIAANINTIAEQTNAIDIDQINKSSVAIADSVESLNESTAETAELVTDISDDLLVMKDQEITKDTLIEAYEGTPIANVLTYQERGQQAIEDAKAKYEEGIALFIHGRDGLIALRKSNKSIKGNVNALFDYTIEMINGGNMAAEGLSILVDEYSAMGQDMLEVADILGIDENDIDDITTLKAALYVAQNETDIHFIDPAAIDMLEDTRAEILAQLDNPKYIDDIDVDPQIDEIFDALKVAAKELPTVNDKLTDQYQKASEVAQNILSEAEKNGTGDKTADETIKLVNSTLDAYEDAKVDIVFLNISDKDIDALKAEFKNIFDSYKSSVKDELKKD